MNPLWSEFKKFDCISYINISPVGCGVALVMKKLSELLLVQERIVCIDFSRKCIWGLWFITSAGLLEIIYITLWKNNT